MHRKEFAIENIAYAIKNAKEDQILVDGTFILGVSGGKKNWSKFSSST